VIGMGILVVAVLPLARFKHEAYRAVPADPRPAGQTM
jgi:hypothetical protein